LRKGFEPPDEGDVERDEGPDSGGVGTDAARAAVVASISP